MLSCIYMGTLYQHYGQKNYKIIYFRIRSEQMDIEQNFTPVIIGYYPFRAKAQVLRLVCEYLHVPYYDRFFNPDDWNKFKEGEGRRWVLKDFPFLAHGDFAVTGNHAMITYVIELSQRTDLLGKTIQHKTKIDTFWSKGDLKDTILGFLCNMRPTTNQQKLERRKQLNELYERKISVLMDLHERECKEDDFYFGYLTILDFAIYEIVNYFRLLFPKETSKFVKLGKLRERVAAIEEVRQYEGSVRAISQFCPIRYFKRFKEEKIRAAREFTSNRETSGGSGSASENKSDMVTQ